MHKISIFLIALAAPAIAMAQSDSATETLAFESRDWRVSAQGARVENYLGREALILQGGRVWLDDAQFTDGVIEFDVAFDERMGFIGPMWRAESDERFEEIYFRTHLSGKPDAVQYTPVENGLSAWQIFSDENAIAPIDLNYDGWNHVKIVVQGDAADFYFNSDKPQLHVPDLKTDIPSGRVGLRASGRGGAEARFFNIKVRALRDSERVIGTPKDVPALPDGLISSWEVSTPFPETQVENALALPDNAAANMKWSALAVETNGIANLAKLSSRQGENDTVFIRLKIDAGETQMKELRFGYSDRVRIYLNGKRVYYGNAGWRVRDYRFLGTVGFFDSVGLDLKRGDNELLVAVSETFGGWAWAGAIEDRSGIEIGE